jgi:hypothetical protein
LRSLDPGGAALSTETVAAGLKQALVKAVERGTSQLGTEGGYTNSCCVRIETPKSMESVANTLRKLGLGSMVDTFEDRMNRGAELAAAQAAPVFLLAIERMSFADAMEILRGGDTAATDYFQNTIGEDLRKLYAPIIGSQLDSVGAVRAYNQIVDRIAGIPLVDAPVLDLEDYTAGKALDGLFSVMAEEEKRIRRDPAARTTELLRRVFGS